LTEADTGARTPRAWFYRSVRFLSLPAFAVWFRVRSEGLEHVPPAGPLILAANHVSYLDPAVVGSTFPRVIRFLIARDVHDHPILRWFYRSMLSIPVDRTGGTARQALKEALRALARGEVVGIFPEGGRVAPGQAEEGLAGVALLARRSGAPVVPVGIAGTDAAMPRGAAWPRPAGVVVRHGEPLVYDSVVGSDRPREGDALFTGAVMTAIRRMRAGGVEAG
jgi:1-acyl-sn-glycerol-3-phosphate acyltransferase